VVHLRGERIGGPDCNGGRKVMGGNQKKKKRRRKVLCQGTSSTMKRGGGFSSKGGESGKQTIYLELPHAIKQNRAFRYVV